MYSLFCFLCVSVEYIQLAKGQATDIRGVFTEGDVKFTWTPDSGNVQSESVSVYLSYSTPWIPVTNRGTYTQKDILNYSTIAIIVKTYFTDDRDPVYNDRYETFKIPKVIKSESGKDIELKLPLDFIPAIGGYSIKNDDKKVVLFNVEKDSVSSTDASKYIYVHKSDTEPKSITIKIKNATAEDAGYIYTGQSSNRNGPGVVLVVTGSPTKPTVTGNANVPVGEVVILTCESKSTSAPSYYKMLPPLTYTWYRNGSKIKRQSNQWRFLVEKRNKYDAITCVSREEIDSLRSEPFKINPKYGPDAVKISPEITGTVDVIEGKRFGPYTCSADCNPSCRYQWQRQKSGNQYDVVGTGLNLTISQVDRTDANIYRCQVDSNYENSYGSTKAIKTVTLRVLYLSEPVVYTDNSIMKTSTFDENVRMNLSCRVEGVPRSSVSILRNKKPLSSGNEWSNYTFYGGLRCEDTGNFTCSGKSSRFNETEKSFYINVLCSTRLDVASSPRILYSSQLGQTVSVIIPVISNPRPNNIVWEKPGNVEIQTRVKQGPVLYRHEIETKIRIRQQSDFGNYTLFVGGKPVIIITIVAEGPPLQPSNFTGNSELEGQITLTWISTFNGGLDQFFLLKQKISSEWLQIKNISDIGQGRQMSYVVNKTVEAAGTYEFMLQSCNRINCSDVIRSVPIKDPVLPPIHFNGQPISATAIRLTWERNDKSAPVKTYVIYQLFEGSWENIANESGLHTKEIFAYIVHQRLRPDKSYSFGIQSCNTKVCSTLQKVLGIYTLGPEESLNTISVVGIALGVALAICVAISIAVWKMCRTKRAFERGIRKGVQVSAAKNEDDIANQRLPVENITDHNEYDVIDEAITCQNNQIEPLVVPKREQYQDVLGVIKADGTSQENLQMTQYGNECGNVGRNATEETADIGKNEYESVGPDDDQGCRLYTDLSRDDEPQGSLYTALSTADKPQSRLYSSLRADHPPRGSVYTSLQPNDEQKGSLYTSLRHEGEPKDI